MVVAGDDCHKDDKPERAGGDRHVRGAEECVIAAVGKGWKVSSMLNAGDLPC